MSLVITSLLVAGGAFVGRWLARSMRGESEDCSGKGTPSTASEANGEPVEAEVKKEECDPFATFPAGLGDVVLRLGTGDEAWLAGALLFREDTIVAALFVAPDAGHDRAVYAKPKPHATLLWLDPVPAEEILAGAEPPTSIEHTGTRFDRIRRLPVIVDRRGSGAPDMGDRAIVAEYHSPSGERLVVVANGSHVRAWRGASLDEGMYDVLRGGTEA